MHVSIHYYVLELDARIIRLYEAFRDTFIEIREGRFPIMQDPFTGACTRLTTSQKNAGLREFFTAADNAFDYFYSHAPLCLILVGEEKYRSVFQSVSKHSDAILTCIEPTQNLGSTAWPIIKEKLAGTANKIVCDLETAFREQRVVTGIENVWSLAKDEKRACLLVEEGFHIRGRIRKKDGELIIENEADVMNVMDNALDIIIDKVIEREGRVVFMEDGTLEEYQKIALIVQC